MTPSPPPRRKAYSKWQGNDLRYYMFLPTGAYLREYHKSGALSTAPEADQKAIQAFIDAANSLLPDATREVAALKLEDMRFEARPPRSLTPPAYLRSEREVRGTLHWAPCTALLESRLIHDIELPGASSTPSPRGFQTICSSDRLAIPLVVLYNRVYTLICFVHDTSNVC